MVKGLGLWLGLAFGESGFGETGLNRYKEAVGGAVAVVWCSCIK